MLSRKTKKFFRSPKSFFEDALNNRIKNHIAKHSNGKTVSTNKTINKTLSLPLMTEHLIACDLVDNSVVQKVLESERKSVVILTHIPFWRNSLGNQCRIYNLADYLRKHYNLTILFNGHLTTYDAKEILASNWSGFIKPIVNKFNAFMYENDYREDSFIKRNDFVLRQILKEFFAENEVDTLIVEYITQELLIRDLNLSCQKIIDIHDIMSLRMKTFIQNGRDHHIKMTEEEEVEILSTFDKVVAIQSDELDFLNLQEKLVGKNLLCHHALIPENFYKDNKLVKRMVYIAGTNPANIDSMEWFIKRVFPKLKELGLELHLFGTICKPITQKFSTIERKGIYTHGPVKSQKVVYEAGDIVVNPVLYGGGLKIKTVEAMAHGLPMVTTEEGAKGLSKLAGKAFLVEDSSDGFIKSIKELVVNEHLRKKLSDYSLEFVKENFSPDACFGEIKKSIDSFKVKKNDVLLPTLSFNEGLQSEKVLILAKRDFPLFYGTNVFQEIFTNSVYKPLSDFKDVKNFYWYIKAFCIDHVIVNNPYISDRFHEFYLAAKALGIKVTTFDRGALPDSWFFDSYGFNGSSDAYLPFNWEHVELDSAKSSSTLSYIESITKTDISLESQNPRKSVDEIKKNAGIDKNKKILFIPFQRPNDTVVKYFSKNVNGMSGFVDLVNEVAKKINTKEWLIVAKKHPLEVDRPLAHVKFLDDVHINDLLQMSDATFQINSGVGLLSLLFGKPTFVCGESFYVHEGLANEIKAAEDLLEKLQEIKARSPDQETLLKFIHFLKNDFYSFGKAKGYLREEKNGELSPITKGIDFYSFNFFDKKSCSHD